MSLDHFLLQIVTIYNGLFRDHGFGLRSAIDPTEKGVSSYDSITFFVLVSKFAVFSATIAGSAWSRRKSRFSIKRHKKPRFARLFMSWFLKFCSLYRTQVKYSSLKLREPFLGDRKVS